MKWNWLLVMATLGGAISALGCPPAPKQDYPVDELARVADLTEVMRVLAQTADPWFGRRTDASFADADYAQMLTDADRVAAAARAAAGPAAGAQPAGFVDFAKALELRAGAWREAAKANDAPAVGTALEAVREQCRGCHSAYR